MVDLEPHKCDKLYDGVLQETSENTTHFLGKQHMITIILQKLSQLSLPKSASIMILNEIPGDPFHVDYNFRAGIWSLRKYFLSNGRIHLFCLQA